MSPRAGLDINIILQHAANLIENEGIEGLTLATLAKSLGVRPPSLYNHFNGLNDLRNLLAAYGLEQLYQQLTESVIGFSGDQAIHEIGKAYVNFVRRYPELYEASLRAPDPNHVNVQEAGEKIVQLSIRILQAYDLTHDEALHAVRGLRSIFHGFASFTIVVNWHS